MEASGARDGTVHPKGKGRDVEKSQRISPLSEESPPIYAYKSA